MNSNILPVDNLYILDIKGNERTLQILDYFDNNIQKYNGLARRKLRVYRITQEMINEGSILKGLEQKGIKTLPAMEIFKPVRQIFETGPEIITFIESLFKAKMIYYQRMQQNKQQSESPLLDDTNKLYNDFYQNEIIGKENEENISANMSADISDRYRSALERRSGKRGASNFEQEPDIEDAPPLRRAPANRGDALPMDDNVAPPQQQQSQQPVAMAGGGGASDDVMSSVIKSAKESGGADADLEISLFQNKFEMTPT